MIEYTLHKLPQGFIITSGDDFHNDNLVPNDFAYHRGTKEVLQVISKNNETGSWLCNDGTNRDCYKLFKVIAQQDQIDFSALSEEEQKEIGWFDVASFASVAVICNGGLITTENEQEVAFSYYYQGFQKAQELLSDRRFTLEDVKKALKLAWLEGHDNRLGINRATREEWENTTIQSLSQQSWKVELEMEWVTDNDDDHDEGGTLPGSLEYYQQPKVTDGKIKILKLI